MLVKDVRKKKCVGLYLLNMRTYASVNNNNSSITFNDVQSRIYIGVHKLVYEY